MTFIEAFAVCLFCMWLNMYNEWSGNLCDGGDDDDDECKIKMCHRHPQLGKYRSQHAGVLLPAGYCYVRLFLAIESVCV